MRFFSRWSTRLWLAPIALLVLLSLFILPLLVFPGQARAAAPVDQLVGFGAGTTGGAGGSSVTVNSLSALTSAVSGSSPKIVNVSGTISGSGDVRVGSNTTILGVGSSASLVGIGLVVNDVSNVIIRNLRISFVTASSGNGDAIHIQHSDHIWVDHNELWSDRSHGTDYYDGLLDITHAGDFITVSWNRFHDHVKTSLIGHSDDNAAEDTGHLRVTYHHNWFYNVTDRVPSLRFGTGHFYNNYVQNVSDKAVHSRMGAQMLVENNVFRSTEEPITTTGDSDEDGFVNERNNDFGGGTNNITQVGTFTSAPYSYPLDATSSVISIVTASSGVGIISGNGGSTPPPTTPATPTATATRPPVTPTTPPTTGGSCRVSYTTNQWPGGFTANITITNTSSSTINGWTLRFTFPGSQQVTQGWNGTFSQSGNQVTITNASYNATIAPNASVTPGFNGTWTGSNPNPTSFTLNGTQCTT